MDAEQLANVVKDIEEEQALGRISAVQVFRSSLNQPELISLSSANATANGPSSGYTEFNLNMPRPIYQVDTLQLLTANIPLCTQNIPDTACVFWYYRLNDYDGQVPNSQNLFCVRLLPSYYKPEFFQIGDPGKYGQNVTFPGYSDVATQLDLACKNDLAYDNLLATIDFWGEEAPIYQPTFIPSDVSITYNAGLNKFLLTGLNTTLNLFAESSVETYDGTVTYDEGDYVTFAISPIGIRIYRSLVGSNLANDPVEVSAYGLTPSSSWAYVSSGLVRDFEPLTLYYEGQYAAYEGGIYQALANVYATEFDFGDWEPGGPWTAGIRYLSAGYGDPNIPIVQGTGKTQWSPYALFESFALVQYEGDIYFSSRQSKGFLPFRVPLEDDSSVFDPARAYVVGQYAFDLDTEEWYVCIKDTIGNSPANATFWSSIVFDPAKTDYNQGDLITWDDGNADIVFWKCIARPPAQATPIETGGYFNTNPYWIPSIWVYLPPGVDPDVDEFAAYTPVIGLNAISKKFDMVTDFPEYPVFSFPVGIPGQPFNPAPRRTLNSILGFTWNGVYNPNAVNAELGLAYASSASTTSDVLNRIRPVPFYFPPPPAPLLGSPLTLGQSTSAITYVAEGYANLVYTSVIALYSSVVFGSTLDTQRNTSLLGLASVNAGNLGIAFYAPFLDTALKVGGGDIYAITIELRDECNEPYPLTNNAITTFTLKLTYKDNPAKNKAFIR